MFHFIGFLIFLAFLVLFILIALARKVISTIFGGVKSVFGSGNTKSSDKKTTDYTQSQYNSSSSSSNYRDAGRKARKRTGKIIDNDEGEYIDFEEIKD